MDVKDVKLKSRRTLFKGRAADIEEIVLEAPRFSGGTMTVSREAVMRPDSAAALVHDTDRDIFILCEQLRVPAWLHGGGWLLELPAGKIDEGETPAQCIRREIEEEIGYRAKTLEPICAYYVSTGYTAERMHLFYAPVTGADLVAAGAHGVDAGEDIRRVEFTRAHFLNQLAAGAFEDAKVLALGAWAINRFAKG